MNTSHHERLPDSRGPFVLSRSVKVAVAMVAIIGGFYLLREHWGHIGGNWFYLLLLACPLMHMFHGHGGHGTPGNTADKFASKEE